VGTSGAVAAAQEGPQAARAPVAVQAPEPVTGERFPRRARLARGSDLAACWEEGRRWRTAHLELAWRPNQTRPPHPRIGFIVPRFQFSAVLRNQLRRRLREVLRRGPLAALPPHDLVVRAKRSAYDLPFPALQAELQEGLRHIT